MVVTQMIGAQAGCWLEAQVWTWMKIDFRPNQGHPIDSNAVVVIVAVAVVIQILSFVDFLT